MKEKDPHSIETVSEECDLCNELNGKDCSFTKIYQNEMRSRVIFQTTNFAVIPTIGQIVEGHTLILPFKHYTSIGGLPAVRILELETLIEMVKDAIASSYGVQPLFFEHGTVGNGKESGGCGIYHMHLHAVPIPSAVNFQALISFPIKKIDSFFKLQEIISKGSSYLLYVDQASNKFVIENEHLPSQYMRKKLAEAIGSEDWDWKSCQREERLVLAYDRLSKAMSQKNKVPQ